MDRLLRRLRASRSDVGATLIETLAAVIILGIAGVAIMTGLQLTVKASDIHRKQSTGGAYVRSYAEAVEKYLNTVGNYVGCGSYGPALVGFTVPSGYTASSSTAVPLDGAGAAITTGTCPTRDKGVQRLTLTVSSNDGRAVEKLTIIVRKACGTGTSCP